MTKDNIMASIDATVYFRIIVPRKAFYFVNDIHVAVQ
jgi:regulator of protease activity HflC (stomatin/prohibitin superfamily)